MKRLVFALTIMLGLVALASTARSAFAWDHHPHKPTAWASPTCADLAINPAYGLAGNPQISGLSAVLLPAGVEPFPFPPFALPFSSYCKVEFTVSTESGPAAGYRVGQSEQIQIRVGLPPNDVDLANPSAAGAVPWNGKTRDLGGGGYVGSLPSVIASTNLGYVGTSTDTGHVGSIIDGSFALNPDNTLNWGLIRDFSRDGIRQQYLWGQKLTKTYYGTHPTRKYWFGCSTGGRQGHYQAQNFPRAYDGILAGSPAFNWDRFIPSELWPQIVMKDEAGGPIAANKLNAASASAIAACDAIDGITDGMVEDPRKCHSSATANICGQPGAPAAPDCLTAQEASAIDKIWNGPVASPGHGGWHHGSGRAWYGLERGAALVGFFNLANPVPFPIAESHHKYWIKRDPTFDWHTVTEASFFNDFLLSVKKFNEVIGTDDGLEGFRRAGGKMITYHGLFDEVIFPRGTYHYYNSVKGSIEQKQKFYRFFPYPNAGHCGGAGLNAEQLFTALVDWVENDVAPDSLVAQVSPTRTRKICVYPDVQVYDGTGSTDDQNNFTCHVRHKDDEELLEQDEFSTSDSSRHV